MDDDKPIKLDMIYGFASTRPVQLALITTGPPLKWYEVIYYGALEIFHEVVVPAILFAGAWTCFMFSARIAFS